MIEIVCNEGENGSTREDKIRRPKNIKQIGEINSNKKIYIEDYAFTFINSIAYSNPEQSKIGVLLGDFQKSGSESYIFIKGAIRVRQPENENKQDIYFNERVWTNIYEDSEKYFHDLQIVGWFAALPDLSKDDFSYLTKLHVDNFAGNNKTLYIINTVEKEENFYLYEDGMLKKQAGYVCYYERNHEMQEYMLDNRGGGSAEVPTEDRVVQSFRTIIQEKKEASEQKKTVSLLYGVSTFMLVVVLVIGINIMNSYEKMQNFDNSLNKIVKEISNMNVSMERTSGAAENKENGTNEEDITPVNKLDGKVYPTEAPTANKQEQQTASQTQTKAENQEPQTNPESESDVPASNKVDNYTVYTVAKGDTLMSICKAHYADAAKYKDVMEANSLDNPDKLFIGQQIKLP